MAVRRVAQHRREQWRRRQDSPESWKLEAGSWKLEAGSWKLEAGSWKLEAGSQDPTTTTKPNNRFSLLTFLPTSSL
jgi:hypothetical protein